MNKLGIKPGDKLAKKYSQRLAASLKASSLEESYEQPEGESLDAKELAKRKADFDQRASGKLVHKMNFGDVLFPIMLLKPPPPEFSTRIVDPTWVADIKRRFNTFQFQKPCMVVIDDRKNFGSWETVLRWVLHDPDRLQMAVWKHPELFHEKIPLYLIAGQHSTTAAQQLLAEGKLDQNCNARQAAVFLASQLTDLSIKKIGSFDNVTTEKDASFKPHKDMYLCVKLFKEIYELRGRPTKGQGRTRTPYTK